MKPLSAAIFLCVLNIFFGIIFIVTSRAWLHLTGIISLTHLPLNISLISLSLFFTSITIITIHHYLQKISLFYYLVLHNSIGALIILYYAMNWGINPPLFFQSLSKKWGVSVNTDRLFPIEHHFKCCGFREVREFSGDNCTASKRLPCLRAMQKNLSSSIKATATFLLAHVFSIFLISYLFYKIVWMRESHYQKPVNVGSMDLGIEI